VEPVEYVFSIDAFTPDTLPMARLAEYLSALAKLIGHPEHTHFVRVDEGSAQLVHKVDAVDAPKVETRLNGVRVGSAPRDALVAFQTLEDLLVNDNAAATFTEVATGRVLVPFVGRDRPKPLTFPPFRENTSINGQIVRIGGRDDTAHATLQDGSTIHTGVNMKRELARELGKLLYGPMVRLHGNGKFERQADGVWKMDDFKVDRYEVLDERSLAETLTLVRTVPNNGLMEPDRYHLVSSLRIGGDEDK
jgi:hypothetical protein